MIPNELTNSHFRQAATEIDREGVRPRRDSNHYDLIIDGKKYPPKYIVSIAARFAFGKEHPASKFNAVEARDYFRSRGYKVIDRRDEAEKLIVTEDEESRFPEGKERFKKHRYLERDSQIVKKAKTNRYIKTGELKCDACETDFSDKYGDLGIGFIEAHHIIPVSSLGGKVNTKISDLALVCSNCHRMLHRGKNITVDKLKEIIRANKKTV